MRQMKDSGIEWIGQIPEDWNIVRVKQAFIRKNEKAQQENPVVLSLARAGVKVRDVSTNEGQVAESYYNYNPVSVGDLLLNPMDLYSGANCSLSEVEGVISPAYVNLKNKEGYFSKFYDYYFKVQYWMMVLFAHGKGVSFDNRWTLNHETLMNFPIVSPDFEIQKRIADFLDEKCGMIDRYIEKQQQVIEKLKAYKQSVITEVVTKGINPDVPMKDSGIEWIGMIPENWNISKMKYLGKFINGYAFPSSSFQSSGTRVLKIANIQPMKISWEDESFVDEKYEALVDYIVEKGDLVFALTRPIINGGIKTAIADFEYIALLNQRNAMFKGGKGITKQWQFYLMQNDLFVQEFAKYIDGTGQQPNISTKEISDIAIPLPPINIQDEITNYLNDKCSHIDRVIKVTQKTIIRMVEYKKSLIYEAVTGKLEV